MKSQQEYIQDIADIRKMMERSSKFSLLSGWAGVLAGLYALIGAAIAYCFLDFRITAATDRLSHIQELSYLGIGILIMAILCAIYCSWQRAIKKGRALWESTTRTLLSLMLLPLGVGGILLLALISQGVHGLLLPVMLLFYGLALYNASFYTYKVVKILAFVEIALGLIAFLCIGQALLCWVLGLGVAHIVYGIYVYQQYEREC